MWKDKNILITGISGFVGPYLARYLLDKGANTFGLFRRRADGVMPKGVVDKNVEKQIHMVEGDLTDITSLGTALDEAKPDVIFHLGAQSFVFRSFSHPLETLEANTIGTGNLLEAVRLKDIDPTIVFAGSSEEYGLVFSSNEQYEHARRKYGAIFPEPETIPELPIRETNHLRPMSPYAVSKIHGDYLMRTYYYSYGLKTIVSRAFNHEGGGRGAMFVTSTIANQVMKLKLEDQNKIVIGNVNAFRDWSHVMDIIKGYALIAEKGKHGEVYNQGSQRTNSVLSYILLCMREAGYEINKIETVKGDKVVENPIEKDVSKLFGAVFEKTKVDRLMFENELEFTIQDKGIYVYTNKGKLLIEFDPMRIRPAEVPVLLSDTSKIQNIGFNVTHTLRDIIKDQLNYFLKAENRV
jgi:GDPmannose 4,6-dehydratase